MNIQGSGGTTGMSFGVMLPHFGPHATPARILATARLAEDLGFDALWVRDHLLWHPHVHERRDGAAAVAADGGSHDHDGHGHAHTVPSVEELRDRTFVEPIVTLAALATVTSRVQLGTSVLIPLRTPAKVAHELASLSYLSGGRVVAGFGAGHDTHEIVAAGMDPDRRREFVEETPAILRRLWTEPYVDHHGPMFTLEGTLEPRPVQPIPLLYGGPSRLAVRIAAEHYDGWMPGVVPFSSLDGRLELLRQLTEGRATKPILAVVPRTSIDRDRMVARRRAKVEGMVADGRRHWVEGRYETVEDLRGALLAGDPGDIAAEVMEFDRRGFDHLVFDLRWQFEQVEEGLELIARQVLSQVGRPTEQPRTSDATVQGLASSGHTGGQGRS